MADKKISALTGATTPLDGTEVLPIVQSGATVKVANNDLRPKQIQSNATTGVLQVAGPGAATTRVMTTPNANFTAARTDAAQTFTGVQTVSVNSQSDGVIINGNDNDNVKLRMVNSSGETWQIQVGQQGASNSNLLFRCNTSSTNAFQADSAGNFYIAGATGQKASGLTWANPSDIRLKNNIQPFTKGLTELLQVSVKTWEYNGKGGTTLGHKGLGVVADEAMIVLPDSVDTYKAKLNAEDEQETDIKRFDGTEITWLLVNAVKEQQNLITSLTERIQALENR
jgi:hypothetical protein